MAQPAPAGPVRDVGPLLLIITAIMSSLTSVFMAVRMLMGILKRRFEWEDALLCFGWVSYIAMCTSDALATRYDFGKALSDVAPEELTNMRLFSGIVASITWSFAITSVKGSFALLYMRFLSHAGRHWVVPLNTTVLIFLACRAIEEFAFNLATDLVLFLQPIPAIWSLRFTSTTKKVAIIAMLSLGLLVCIISIIRLFAVLKLIRGDGNAYERAIAIIWCQVEAGALIICSCVPHLHQVASRIEPIRKLLNLEAGSHRTSGQGVVTGPVERWRSRIKNFKGLGARGGDVAGDEERATAADASSVTMEPAAATPRRA